MIYGFGIEICSVLRVKDSGGKVSSNPFVRPSPPILIKPKPTQLLIGLNGHQPN